MVTNAVDVLADTPAMVKDAIGIEMLVKVTPAIRKSSAIRLTIRRTSNAVHVHWDMWVTVQYASMRTNASWLDPVIPEYGASISIPDTDATGVRQVTPDQ